MRSLLVLGVLAATALAQYRAQVPVETRSLNEIYLAAISERNSTGDHGPLRVFWGGDDGAQGQGIINSWKAQFPDIPLNLSVDLSKYHDNRIDRAYFEDISVTDAVVIQTLHDFTRWKSANRLLYYKPSNFEDLLATEKDFDGAYLPISIYGFGTIYWDNTKLNSSEIPDSFEEFASPKWSGKLILTYPNDDDAVAYLFSLIVAHYGSSWLYGLANNNVTWVRGTATPGNLINSKYHNSTSPVALTFTGGAGGSFISNKAVSAPEQTMSWAQTGAILADTPRPEAAKLFMSFLTSAERQRANGLGPSPLNSLNEEAGVDVYGSNITDITKFRRWEHDRAGVEWWKNMFEEVLGTPQGPGPLEMYPNPA